MAAPDLSLADIEAAQALLGGHVVHTPCLHSVTLSELTGAEVWLKFENLQFTASFKERGALVALSRLTTEQRARGVIAMSAGNHAQAVAYRAQALGVPAVIVMPRFTPDAKVQHTRGFGAEVLLEGETLSEAGSRARALAAERGLHLLHPYDDPAIIAGQGTVGLEMLEEVPGLDALIVPVGGGGLISGMAVAAKALKPEIDVVGVQTARFPAMRQALAGEEISCGSYTIAEGIAVKEPGRLTLPLVRALVSDLLLVEDERIEEAVLLLLDVEKTVVEGAGAAALAALLAYGERFRGRRVGVVLSGGNADLLALASIIHRGLYRTGRLVRLLVEGRDVPGLLAGVTACLAEAAANIIEVVHQRTFIQSPPQSVEIEFVLRTRGEPHLREIIDLLSAGGYRPRLPVD